MRLQPNPTWAVPRNSIHAGRKKKKRKEREERKGKGGARGEEINKRKKRGGKVGLCVSRQKCQEALSLPDKTEQTKLN